MYLVFLNVDYLYLSDGTCLPQFAKKLFSANPNYVGKLFGRKP